MTVSMASHSEEGPGLSSVLDAAEEEALAAVMDTMDAADCFDNKQLVEALALFEMGDFSTAEGVAADAEMTARADAAVKVHLARAIAAGAPYSGGDDLDGTARFGEDDGGPRPTEQDWKSSLDMLATAYQDAGYTDRAEGLYLRMLAWREGAEQFRHSHFGVSAQLFKRSPDYKTVEDATWFLSTLRPDDGHAVPEVVGLLALGVQVAAKAAVACYTLALRPKQRAKIVECGGLELLAKAVSFHAENAELQAAGCGALRMLCTGGTLAARNRRQFLEQLDGAEALTNAIRMHPEDPEVLREACGALAAACEKYPGGARRIVESEGMILCMEAMVSVQGADGRVLDEAVGDAACKALAAMQCASQAPGEDMPDDEREDFEAVWQDKLKDERELAMGTLEEELGERMAAADRLAVQALLQAMAVLIEDSSLRHRALPLIEVVVGCMQMFQGAPKVQSPACSIILQLTNAHLLRDEAVAKVALCGGIATLCQTMKDLPCNEPLQQAAVGSLRNMAYGSDAYKTLAVRSNGIQCTVTAMMRYAKNQVLQENAIGSLMSLCDQAGRAALCARLGGVDAIIAAMKNHINVSRIAERGCIILCMFCDDGQLRKQILSAGALDVAKALSRTGSSEVQRWGCELLRDLTDSSA
eukprot:TRINITY_DN32240_c0_g1_i1.p1 TRINITY_DN32240_c0_g1~~TRINITY_DN32240_c0_g1_i1.p1  ORF type:complete len:644 (+),score=209.40 TRINITY_DN32240_c0_g1_i1:90-2021(+)